MLAKKGSQNQDTQRAEPALYLHSCLQKCLTEKRMQDRTTGKLKGCSISPTRCMGNIQSHPPPPLERWKCPSAGMSHGENVGKYEAVTYKLLMVIFHLFEISFQRNSRTLWCDILKLNSGGEILNPGGRLQVRVHQFSPKQIEMKLFYKQPILKESLHCFKETAGESEQADPNATPKPAEFHLTLLITPRIEKKSSNPLDAGAGFHSVIFLPNTCFSSSFLSYIHFYLYLPISQNTPSSVYISLKCDRDENAKALIQINIYLLTHIQKQEPEQQVLLVFPVISHHHNKMAKSGNGIQANIHAKRKNLAK